MFTELEIVGLEFGMQRALRRNALPSLFNSYVHTKVYIQINTSGATSLADAGAKAQCHDQRRTFLHPYRLRYYYQQCPYAYRQSSNTQKLAPYTNRIISSVEQFVRVKTKVKTQIRCRGVSDGDERYFYRDRLYFWWNSTELLAWLLSQCSLRGMCPGIHRLSVLYKVSIRLLRNFIHYILIQPLCLTCGLLERRQLNTHMSSIVKFDETLWGARTLSPRTFQAFFHSLSYLWYLSRYQSMECNTPWLNRL